MTSDARNEERIRETWSKNSNPWSAAVRGNSIKSRVGVTNDAIVEAIVGLKPRRVLDVGCGEGWLARRLASEGIDVLGIDAEPSLIAEAKAAGGGTFMTVQYEELAASGITFSADVAVANFSLIGKESVETLLPALHDFLSGGGALVVQTLHPVVVCGDLPYCDGWREGSWDGCGQGFKDPAPWYFRTVESRGSLMKDSGFELAEIREPLDPDSGQPASLLLIGCQQSIARS